jgi:hypothetical protein
MSAIRALEEAVETLEVAPEQSDVVDGGTEIPREAARSDTDEMDADARGAKRTRRGDGGA